jgi:hypothetical protein
MIREHEGTSLRSFHGPGSRVKRSFQSDGEARAVLRQVLAAAGLSGMEDRILLRASAEIDAAEAGIEKDKDGNDERLIFYNAEFMQRLRQQTREYWSMVAVLAHEVGHHVRLHTVIVGRDHEFELEADYQAGFILRRMGATLEQAQAAFRSIAPEQASATHPGRAQRVQAVTLGWADGGANQQSSVTPGTVPPPSESKASSPQKKPSEPASPKLEVPKAERVPNPPAGSSSGQPQAKPEPSAPRSFDISSSGWMAAQNYSSCSQVRGKCEKSGNKAYPTVCEDRLKNCLRTGCWRTNTQGHACGLERR